MYIYDIKPMIETNNMTEYMTDFITNNTTSIKCLPN